MHRYFNDSRAFLYTNGVKAYPSPRSAIRYEDGSAKPFTAESARAYYGELKTLIASVLKNILAGWESFNKLGHDEEGIT